MAYTATPRAVVPCTSMLSSRDVLLPSFAQARSSSGPIGIALYGSDAENATIKKMLPTYYVSPDVASSRGRGVLPGWYVIARPGQHFEIHVSPNHEGTADVLEAGEGILAELRIDGSEQQHGSIFDCDSDYEYVIDGFCERRQKLESGKLVNVTRPYVFAKAKCVEEGASTEDEQEGGAGLSSVELVVSHGCMKTGYEELKATEKVAFEEKNAISEKKMVKMGQSLNVRCASTTTETLAYADFISLENAEVMPDASVTIYLRESYFMRSRSLIDDKHRPLTYDMYKSLPQHPRIPLIPGVIEVTDDDTDQLKNPRRDKPMHAGAVIDLDDSEIEAEELSEQPQVDSSLRKNGLNTLTVNKRKRRKIEGIVSNLLSSSNAGQVNEKQTEETTGPIGPKLDAAESKNNNVREAMIEEITRKVMHKLENDNVGLESAKGMIEKRSRQVIHHASASRKRSWSVDSVLSDGCDENANGKPAEVANVGHTDGDVKPIGLEMNSRAKSLVKVEPRSEPVKDFIVID